MRVCDSILDLVGQTPMVRLSKIAKGLRSEILLKLEFFNPSGSVKDRIALYMIEEAERRGLLKKGGTVVEPTSGNTGIGLAFVCAVKGYKMIAVMPEAMSEERVRIMRALGAKVVTTKCNAGKGGGSFTREDLERCINRAKQLAKKPNTYLPNQFSNRDNVEAHRRTTAEEIWGQTGGKIDAFVAAVGTGGTTTGVGEVLKERNPKIRVVAVEPKSSAVMSGEKPGYHRIQGIGEGFVPEVMRCEICDEIIKVSDTEAIKMCNRLAKEEGIFAGISSGANVAAAIKVAKRMPKGSVVVTLAPDSGSRYLTANVFKERWSFC